MDIVLLGGSNSVMVNGLQLGIKEEVTAMGGGLS